MKTREKDSIYMGHVLKVLDCIILILMSVLLIQKCLGVTMFNIVWPDRFVERVTLLLGLFTMLKIFCDSNKEIKTKIFIWIVVVCYILSFRHANHHIVIESAFLLLAFYNYNYKLVLTVFGGIAFGVSVIAFICSRTGVIVDLIYIVNDNFRHAFGSRYPTNFAANIFFILVAWTICRAEKCTYLEVVLMVAVAIILHLFCHTRNSEIAILMLAGWIALLKYKPMLFSKIINNRKAVLAIIIAPIIMSIVMFPLCWCYTKNSSVMLWMNKALSQRLKLGQNTLHDNPVTLFGQVIQMVGRGGRVKSPEKYTFIDISYMNIAMRFGVAILVVVMILIIVLLLRNINNPYIVFCVLLICLHSMIEHHLFDYHYNILMVLPFAKFSSDFIITDVLRPLKQRL